MRTALILLAVMPYRIECAPAALFPTTPPIVARLLVDSSGANESAPAVRQEVVDDLIDRLREMSEE